MVKALIYKDNLPVQGVVFVVKNRGFWGDSRLCGAED
jgi:hypothetical protein